VLERVANDHFQSAALAVERCVELGYRRVGLALCRETSLRLDHRALAGYEFALGRLGVETRLPPLQPQTDAELLPALAPWLRQGKPDVVIFDNSYAESQAAVPAAVGFVSLAVDRPDDPVAGIFQNYPLLGRVALEHVAAKLYTNSFGSLEESHLHLVAGRWVGGRTAPGPRRRRVRA
jgi:LacI family transcriptional regulator